jgi:hypothetical protein
MVATRHGEQMRIPPAYQTHALTFPPSSEQVAQNRQEVNRETSVSVRLGKFGITYSTQDTSPERSVSPSTTFSRPTTSFAQEFSLALARQSESTPSLFSQSYQNSPSSSPSARNQAFQAYTFQADYQAALSTPTFSAMV